MDVQTLLLVEDLEQTRKAVKRILRGNSFEVVEAENGKQALELIEGGSHIDIILLDLKMPVMDGMDFLKIYAENKWSIPVIVCSGNDDLAQAIECMKLGANDYLPKPYQPEILLKRIENLMQNRNLSNENIYLKNKLEANNPWTIIGQGPGIQKANLLLSKLARRDCTVLINGETGTGKELAAKVIHYGGIREKEPFVVVDCAALSESVLASELFGYEKGAFTGAVQNKKGLIESAGKGTLFFDEIGELPMSMQTSLLRILQEKEFRPIGALSYKSCEARIVAATNRDLLQEVKEGRFREDLYYRLNVVRVVLPPLRERREDIPLLIEFFLNKTDRNLTLSEDALKEVLRNNWQGNVRELENVLSRGTALCDGEVIELEDLFPDEIPSSTNGNEINVLIKIDEYEKQAIIKALEMTGGNKKEAAELIGLGQATLYRKIKEYSIE